MSSSRYMQAHELLCGADPEHEAVYEDCRKALKYNWQIVKVQAGGPPSASELTLCPDVDGVLDDTLMWRLRHALATPRLGPTCVYFQGVRRVRDRGKRETLVRWLFSRGWPTQAVGDALGIPQASTLKYGPTGRARGQRNIMDVPMDATALSSGLALVENIVFGSSRAPKYDSPALDERLTALASAQHKSETHMQKRCCRAAAVLADMNAAVSGKVQITGME